jgi:excisionase family DNA binding protein
MAETKHKKGVIAMPLQPTSQQKSADMVWTVREAARRLKVSDRTFRKRARQGVIPHLRFGGKILFPVAALEAWIAKQTRRGGK